jgi:hypothetical protein
MEIPLANSIVSVFFSKYEIEDPMDWYILYSNELICNLAGIKLQ